jgi:hypothetical protein
MPMKSLVLMLVLILSACVTTDEEWEAYYRETCQTEAVPKWESRSPTEAEILHCLELKHSGFGPRDQIHEGTGAFDIFRH